MGSQLLSTARCTVSSSGRCVYLCASSTSAAEAGGILQGEMMRQLSVASHAGHMRVLYQRLRWVGMSPAHADRAGGAQGVR